MAQWFRRLSDVPGVGYKSDPNIDRRCLPGHDAIPEVVRFQMDGEQCEDLSWPTSDGSTSASPAKEYRPKDDSTAGLLRYVSGVLELPGEPSDYHFAIQEVIEELWKRRREEPQRLSDLERLCWLDLRLVEAKPEAVSYRQDGEEQFVRVLAFSRLIYLYEREGLLNDALTVARLAKRFQQGDEDVERIQTRIADLPPESGRS